MRPSALTTVWSSRRSESLSTTAALSQPWHEDRKLFGPWLRYEAELVDYSVLREVGTTPWEAASRLLGHHRVLLEPRWAG